MSQLEKTLVRIKQQTIYEFVAIDSQNAEQAYKDARRFVTALRFAGQHAYLSSPYPYTYQAIVETTIVDFKD
jgi:hypothetical protein